MNACTACGNAAAECTCDGGPTFAPVVTGLPRRPRSPATAASPRVESTAYGSFQTHKMGCHTCRSGEGLCKTGRRLYGAMQRAAGRSKKARGS